MRSKPKAATFLVGLAQRFCQNFSGKAAVAFATTKVCCCMSVLNDERMNLKGDMSFISFLWLVMVVCSGGWVVVVVMVMGEEGLR